MNAVDPIPFKMFGLHRTGTNLMVALLMRNFSVHSLEIGAEWKHGPVEDPDRCWHDQLWRFLLCVRDPYAWALSCYRYFRRANGSDATVAPQFQSDPSMTFEEFLLTPTYSFDSPLHRWNQMNQLWFDTLPRDRTVLVRHEDLLHDQIAVLQEIECALRLKRRAIQLQATDEKIDVNASPVGPFNRDYYLDREYMLEYPVSMLLYMQSVLNPALMGRLSYKHERWSLADKQIRSMRIVTRNCTADAKDAREITFDPYHFNEIRTINDDLRSVVDVGAHIGATAILARQMWPQCQVLAYEPCPENFRVLRINARRAENIKPMELAMTDGSRSIVPFRLPSGAVAHWCETGDRVAGEGPGNVSAVSLAHAIRQLGSIDLLKLGCSGSAVEILRCAKSSGMLTNVRWVCARVRAIDSDAAIKCLSRSHDVKQFHNSSGYFLLAKRLD